MKATHELIKNLGIDSYIDWLKDIYENIQDLRIKLNIEYDKQIKIAKLQYLTNLNQKKYNVKYTKRLKWLSEIEKETKKHVKYLEEYKEYAFFFVSIDEKVKTLKEYDPFKSLDIESINAIKTFNYINLFYDTNILEIEQKINISKSYYQTKYNELLNKDYNFLEFILNIEFSKEFNKESANTELITEFSDLKTLKYLYDKIHNIEVEPEIPTQLKNRLKWTGSQLELITLFYDLKETGLIKGTKADILRLIHYNFIDKDNKIMTKNNIEKNLKPESNIDNIKAKRRINLTNFYKT